MNKPDQRLLDLTNKFLNEFFDVAYQIDKENNTRTKNDSFYFNYKLPECLSLSDIVKDEEFSNPLIDMGFVDNTCKSFFKERIKGITKDIVFIIDNFDNQYSYSDYFAKDLKCEVLDDEDGNKIARIVDKTLKHPEKEIYDEKKEIFSFTIQNNKSGFKGEIILTRDFKTKVVNSINFFGLENYKGKIDRELAFSISPRQNFEIEDRIEYSEEEPTIGHYKHCATINSFYFTIDQIIYGINEALKNNQ